ncbi:Protein quaking-A, partial [Trichinella papuae]
LTLLSVWLIMSVRRAFFERKLRLNDELEYALRTAPPGRSTNRMLERYVNALFTIPMFRVRPLPPRGLGRIKKSHGLILISRCQYSFNVASRIIGPRGSTVKSLEQYCGCDIYVEPLNQCILKISISVVDYENVVNWRIGLAKEGLRMLIEERNDNNNLILKLQLAELAVWNRTFQNRLLNRHVENFNNNSAQDENDGETPDGSLLE